MPMKKNVKILLFYRKRILLAFSLAEMMVVMLILSIVMAASMPIITKRTRIQRDNSLPYGVIVIWHGNTSSIPDGWCLCDGTNGTPDLRSRFVYGAGSDNSTKSAWHSGWDGNCHNVVPAPSNPGGDFSPLWYGGEEQHILSIPEIAQHNHTASAGNQSSDHTHSGTTSSNGLHSHTINIDNGSLSYNIWHFSSGGPGRTQPTSQDGAHTHTFTTGGVSNNHTHTITVNNNGSGNAHNIMPRFMVLAYIMKI